MKEIKDGNTTIIIHSTIAHLSFEEQKEWYEQEWKKGNPILKNIIEAAIKCETD